MRVAVSGASGLIGRALMPALAKRGHDPVALVRGQQRPGALSWDPHAGTIDSLEGIDAVVHLAGESVAGRWTEERKGRIVESRTKGTALIANAVVKGGVGVLISASAVGYYGDRGATELDETAAAGEGFLAGVCVQWEGAADAARASSVRVAHPRIGIVLAARGGALEKMKTPFKMGVGGVIGDGRQYMSWVALEDVVEALLFALEHDVAGPFNVVAPTPATNAEFTDALGKALRRPTFLPLPRFAARLAMGREMADEMLLTSTRAIPKKLRQLGFEFRHADLDSALRAALGV